MIPNLGRRAKAIDFIVALIVILTFSLFVAFGSASAVQCETDTECEQMHGADNG